MCNVIEGGAGCKRWVGLTSCSCIVSCYVGGGDWEECYELVLYEARTKLSWTPGTQRSLVMIGDAIPHGTSYPMNTLKLDWKKEAKQLYDDLGVKIYSVQVSHTTELLAV